MKSKFYFFSDPAHGWLRVDRDTLTELGLTQNDFTEYSYIDIHYMYLEEDHDAPKFMTAWAKRMPSTSKLQIVERVSEKKDSFVRRKYQNYRIKEVA